MATMRRSFSASLQISCFFVFNYLSSISRAYYIDDSNQTAIQYIPPFKWVHDSIDPAVDLSKLYNQTYTYTQCFFRDGCRIRIPFTGSGITVYQLQWDHLNASMTMDGNFTKAYVHDVSCARRSPRGCYNTTLFDMQSLPYRDHLLEIQLQDSLGDYSNLNLDYVFINETRSSATASANNKRIPTAAIVGGTIAGLAFVIFTILLALYIKRRPTHTPKDDLSESFSVGRPDPFMLQAPSPLPMNSYPPSAKAQIRMNAPPVMPTPFGNGPGSSSSSSNPMDLRMTKAAMFGPGAVGRPMGGALAIQPGESEYPTPDATSPHGHFTEEQISSMTQRLLRQNMPAPVVATVVESMIHANVEASASASQGEGSAAGSVRNSQTVTDAAPPSYYHHQVNSRRLQGPA